MKKTIKAMLYSLLLLMVATGCQKEDVPTNNNGNSNNSTTPNYPVAAFSTSVDGKTVTVSNFSTNYTTLRWDWGDGEISTSQYETTHTYSSYGTYTITLTVTSSTGLTDYSTKSITIQRPAPTSVTITSLKLYRFPETPASGGSWDTYGKPDIYFTITDRNETTTYYTSPVKEDVMNYDCPLTYSTIYCSLSNLASTYLISFYDDDGVLGNNDYMGGCLWTPATANDNYASSYDWLGVDFVFTLFLTWYSANGEPLYTKSVDFNEGRWQTDDPEVRQALGL